MVVIWFTGIALGLSAEPGEAPERVLMIHSFGRDFAPFSLTAEQFRTDLALQSPRSIEFVEASLQTIETAPEREEQEIALVDFLAATFKNGEPDLVVSFGAPAAYFFRKYHERLFPRVPHLVAAADQRRLTSVSPSENIVQASLELDLTQLLKDILTAKPNTRKIYYVTGVTPLEKYWEQENRETWNQFREDIEFHSLSNQSLKQMLETVSRLPRDSAVFFAIFDRDSAGVPHVGNAALQQIKWSTSAPIFGYSTEQIGLGIVGGHMMDFRKAGTHAASAAVKLLEGVPSNQIQIEPVGHSPPTYDWRELKRWNIRESLLPENSRIRFRQRSLWETHRRAVLIAATVIGAQVLVILLLVSARRRAREMSEGLTLAANAANVGVWEVDLKQNAIKATGKWRELFGFPAEGPIQLEEIFEHIHPDDRSMLREAINEAALNDRIYMVQHRICRTDGEERWLISRGRADRIRGSGHLRTRGVSIDITDRLRNESQIHDQREQLSHLSRVGSLGAISGSLAHELNQPLGTILSNAQAARRMLTKPEPDLAEIKEILGDIVQEDQRAAQVITKWREMLRRGETSIQPVNLKDCVEDVLRLAREQLLREKIAVNLELPDDLPKVMADRIQLQQVILNLLINAIDAMKDTPSPQKEIHLQGNTEARQVVISVTDHGSGLPGDPEKLFEPFHTTKPMGLGMGLAICRTFVSAGGGKLWAEPHVNGGATFLLALPRVSGENGGTPV